MIRRGRGADGQITVFLALCVGIMLSVVLAEIESARYAAVIDIQKTAVMTACQSALAEFNRPLMEKYDIFAVDGNGRNLTEDMQDEIEKNSGTGLFKANVENVVLTDLCPIADAQYQPMVKEIVQYMSTAGLLDAGGTLDSVFNDRIADAQSGRQQMAQRLQNGEAQSAAEKDAYDASHQDQDSDSGSGTSQGDGAGNAPDGGSGGQKKPVDPRKKVSDLLKQGLLSLVVPDGFEISNAELDRGKAYESFHEEKFNFMSVRSVLDRLNDGSFQFSNVIRNMGDQLIVLRYMQNRFKNAVSDENVPFDTRLQYEMEYLICGHQSDSTNLLDIVSRLMLLRTIFNFSYLYSDAAKSAEVHSLSATIAGGLLMPWLEPVITVLVMAAWAYAEALIDVRTLLCGQKVSLIKTSANWTLSLTGLSAISAGTIRESSGGGDSSGLSYETYLMMLLMLTGQQKRMERMADLMTANIRMEEGYAHFSMDDCFYSIGCITEYSIAPLFTSHLGRLRGFRRSFQWSECY